MQYLWNTGREAEKFVEKMVAETKLPLFMADHPVPQDFAVREGYDEGVAILQNLVALCSERPLSPNERKIVEDWWTS